MPQTIDLGFVHRELRNAIIGKHQVVVLPDYFRRWIPLLEPSLAWLVIGLRQSVYLKTGGEYGQTVSVSAAEIARWSGLSRRQVWRLLKDPRLGWLVRVERNRRNGEGEQIPNRYHVLADLPLTPFDADALMEYLLRCGVKQNPIQALAQALAAPREEVLGDLDLAPLCRDLSPKPLTVQDVVLSVLPSGADVEVIHTALKLADELAARLTGREKTIGIPWYFLRHHVPRLKPGPAWLVVLLRDRVYHEDGVEQGEVFVPGGVQEIAAWLGVTDRTCKNWFANETLGDFIQRTSMKRGEGWRLSVRLTLPLAEEHRPLYDLALQLIAVAVSDDQGREAVLKAVDTCEQGGGVDALLEVIHRKGKNGTRWSEKMAQGGEEVIHRKGKNGTRWSEKMAHGSNRHLHLLIKSLKEILLSTSSKVDSESIEAAAGKTQGGGGDFHLEEALERAMVYPQAKDYLLNQPPEQVIARLLTWANGDFNSSAGAALGVLAKGRAVPSTPEVQRLAKHPRLKQYLLDPASRDETWFQVMGQADEERIAQVAEILYGVRPRPTNKYLSGPFANYIEH